MRLSSLIRVILRAWLGLSWTFLLHWFLRFRQIFLRGRYRKHRPLDVLGLWGTGLARIMGVHIHVRNQRSGPMGDVIIANHMGFLDIPILFTYYPAVFIIKMEMRRVFYFGRALELQGHVFVERGSEASRRSAREGVQKVLDDGDRIIVFPEGRASPGAERLPFKPFCFFEAHKQGKRVEACIIDYLPDREMLKWDTSRGMIPQLVELVGRRRTDVSVEFLPAELIEDPDEAAQRYHDVIQGKLEQYDRERKPSTGAIEP